MSNQSNRHSAKHSIAIAICILSAYASVSDAETITGDFDPSDELKAAPTVTLTPELTAKLALASNAGATTAVVRDGRVFFVRVPRVPAPPAKVTPALDAE